MSNILSSLRFRVFENLKTTLGGGTVLGVLSAIVIGKLEEMSGCKLREAFMGIDWVQFITFLIVQIFGAFVTDGNKTVPVNK
ncbi:MAG: hypothetical protein QW514_10305 [Thermoprotei archaeon]